MEAAVPKGLASNRWIANIIWEGRGCVASTKNYQKNQGSKMLTTVTSIPISGFTLTIIVAAKVKDGYYTCHDKVIATVSNTLYYESFKRIFDFVL